MGFGVFTRQERDRPRQERKKRQGDHEAQQGNLRPWKASSKNQRKAKRGHLGYSYVHMLESDGRPNGA